MGKWSDLQADMLGQIAKRLDVAADRVRFSVVCKNWLQIADSQPRYLPCPPPWLMLAEKPGTTVRSFVGLTTDDKEGPIFELDLPEAQGTRCVGSTGLWIVTVSVKGDIHLLNPFTGEKRIGLPPVSGLEDYTEYISYGELTSVKIGDPLVPRKVVISSLDTAMAIYDGSRKLAFARGGGSNSWTTVDHKQRCFFDVLVYHQKFFGVKVNGRVFECDLDSPAVAVISEPLKIKWARGMYLVEWLGMLLQVLKIIDIDTFEDGCHKTIGFQIYRLDSGKWIKVNDLGEHSLFLGVNTSVALLASESSTFKPNCVYFMDDYGIVDDEIQNGADMGVFSLCDGTIKAHYKGVSLSFFSPPIWIVPSSLYPPRVCQQPHPILKDPNHQGGSSNEEIIISMAKSDKGHSSRRCVECGHQLPL